MMKRSAILVVLMLLSLTATCQFHLTPVNSQEAARLKRQTGWDSNSERKGSSKTSYRVNVKEVTIQPYSKEMLMRAKAGNITAQRELAICYFRGLGINKNYQKAAKWLMIAALNGDVDAMVYVKLTSTKGYCQYYPDDLNNITNELQRFTSEQIAMAKYHYYTYMETDVNKQEKYLLLAARKKQPDTKSVQTEQPVAQTSQERLTESPLSDNSSHKLSSGATWTGNLRYGYPWGEGVLSIPLSSPYQGQTIKVKITEFERHGEPIEGEFYAFGSKFTFISRIGYIYINYDYGRTYPHRIAYFLRGNLDVLTDNILSNLENFKNAKELGARLREKGDAYDRKLKKEIEEAQAKMKYHEIPREVRCLFCLGNGCTYCYHRGYVKQHYY